MALRRAASSLAARSGLSMRAVPTGNASADAFRGVLTRWMSTCEFWGSKEKKKKNGAPILWGRSGEGDSSERAVVAGRPGRIGPATHTGA